MLPSDIHMYSRASSCPPLINTRKLKQSRGWACWHTHVILAPGRLKQEAHKATLQQSVSKGRNKRNLWEVSVLVCIRNNTGDRPQNFREYMELLTFWACVSEIVILICFYCFLFLYQGWLGKSSSSSSSTPPAPLSKACWAARWPSRWRHWHKPENLSVSPKTPESRFLTSTLVLLRTQKGFCLFKIILDSCQIQYFVYSSPFNCLVAVAVGVFFF